MNNSSKYIIRNPKNKIEWEEYYLLRYNLLRKPLGQPLGSEKNEGDLTGTHFALFVGDSIIGVARLDRIDAKINQIRFFAIEEKQQGKGYGKKLLDAIEESARMKHCEKIILQARENAISFYERNDYVIVKKTHLLFGEIQHWLMEKWI